MLRSYFMHVKLEVLNWLESVRIPGSNTEYRFSRNSDSTIFCSCFALFILDLFKETENLSAAKQKEWIEHIQSFQDNDTGYFEPEKYFHKDKERNRLQLTCFCLSALKILNTEPKYPLRFISQWVKPTDVEEYLISRDCHKGFGGSGNKAMFLGILLTYEYERTQNTDLLLNIDKWFEFHEQYQNPKTGFWGTDKKCQYYKGLQNAFHQFIVFFYWKRQIRYSNSVINIALKLQDHQGFFASTPGGEACSDYDAIHLLTSFYRSSKNKQKIEDTLKKAWYAILQNQKKDGGFCQAKGIPFSMRGIAGIIKFFFAGKDPYLWYYRIRKSVGTLARYKEKIHTGWTKYGRAWNESNLWDTWFRCLALAEITRVLNEEKYLSFMNTRFHDMIGLGYFNINNDSKKKQLMKLSKKNKYNQSVC